VIVGFRVLKSDEVRFRGEDRKEDPLLLTPRACAARLKISRSHLYTILDSPDGPKSISIGRCRRIQESELQRWLDELSD
jgi:predicted DNA-binding transcriptional regulator AlpA